MTRVGPWGHGWSLLIAVALFLVSQQSRAESEPVSGPWDASPLQVSWAVGSWGASCGARPGGGGDGGGTVTLTAAGSDFNWSGLGRSYSTTSCWEQMPGLQVRSHSASPTTIRTTCEMPKGDPRQAKLVTTWALRGDKIYFDETAQYQFVGKEGSCTASARRTRLLSRSTQSALPGQPEPKAEEPVQKPDSVDISTKPDPNRCTGSEPAETVILTPRASVLRGGDPLTFDVVVRGERGCPVREKPRVEIAKGRELIEVRDDGSFSVLPTATSGQVTLRAIVHEIEATQTVLVVSQAELRALLGEAETVAPLPIEPAHTDAAMATDDQSDPEPLRKTLLLSLFAAVLGCGAVLYWFRKRPGKQKLGTAASDPEAVGAAEVARAASSAPSADLAGAGDESRSTPPPPRTKGRLCPICGERYPLEIVFCGKDGARLVREN